MDLGSFSDKMAELARSVPSIQAKALRQAAIRTENYLKTERIPAIKPFPPLDTGLYLKSWKVTSTELGAILHNDSPYAGIIEWGARPHIPPVKPLCVWIGRRLHGSPELGRKALKFVGMAKRVRAQRKGQKSGRTEGNVPPEIAIAFAAVAIQERISARGQAPKHVVTGATDRIEKFVADSCERAVEKWAEGRKE